MTRPHLCDTMLEPLNIRRINPYAVLSKSNYYACVSETEKAGVKLIMYAIIKTGGKQYKVAPGDEIYVEKLTSEPEETVTFDEVLAVSDGEALKIGSPFVKNAKVTAKVIKNGKGKKLRVFTYKCKKSKQRTLGHRQPYTKLQIEEITAGGAKKAPAKKAAEA